MNKLVGILELRVPSGLAARYGWDEQIADSPRPRGVRRPPYEHHSNELPWRESIADLVVIDEDADGHIDVEQLKQQLIEHSDRPLRIGSFSAASNVTGVLSDTDRIAALLHEHDALSFWDYAAAGPYVPIRMRESTPGRGDYKDAIFLSPHKFVGGPPDPGGVLVIRRELVRNTVPTVPGGGARWPSWTRSATATSTIPWPGKREAPPRRSSSRSAPAWSSPSRTPWGGPTSSSSENDVCGATPWTGGTAIRVSRFSAPPDARRLSIVSFRLRSGTDRYLHHNYVVALLNDLFGGVQARGGCSCAGPYGHRLLGIDPHQSRAFRDEIALGCEGIKPGWTRINFNYFISDTVRDYLIEAVELLARYGHRLLTDYTFSPILACGTTVEKFVSRPCG